MKYCLRYEKKSSFMDKVDEIIYYFNGKEVSEDLINLIKEKPNTKITLFLDGINVSKNKDMLLALTQYSNVQYQLDIYNNNHKEIIKDLKEKNAKFYLKNLANNYDTFSEFVELGVSEIFITGRLCFDLRTVKRVADDANVEIRVNPAVVQPDRLTAVNEKESLYSFFIRPEDTDIYDYYIDTYDFSLLEKQDTYYRVYSIDKIWYGDLSELIVGLKIHLDSRCLIPYFANKRVNCDKKCKKGNPCDCCGATLPLMAELEEKHTYFIKDKTE